jgi:signal transduction histidine kinase
MLSRLRLRLAAGFALAFGLALGLLALASLGYLWFESRARLDARLDRGARGVAEFVRREAMETPDSTLLYAITEVLLEWPTTGEHWLITDEHGALLATTDSAGQAGVLAAESRTATSPKTVSIGRSDLRLIRVDDSVALTPSRVSRYRVVAFGSTFGIEEDTEALAAALAIAAPLIILLSLIGGYIIAGKALRPVKQLGDTIAAIAPGDLSRRIDVAGRRDELTTLSVEFNRLFERLQEAQIRNRQFIHEAAHQIRTPLTLVLGEVDLDRLASDHANEPSRQVLQRIGLAAQQMRRRVDELFLLAEAEASTAIPLDEDVELDGLALECTDLMRARAAAAGRVLALGVVTHVAVRGNAGLLREALLELLENACRYGGDSAPVLTEVFREAGWGVLTVSNSAQVDSPRSSTGRQLGLRIVTWIVEGHGGQLATEDLHDTYRVRVRIPLTE